MAGKPIGAAGADIADRLRKLGTAVEKGSRDTTVDMGMTAKTVHLAVLRADSGGDLRLSGFGRAKGRQGNRKIGARYTIDRRGSGYRAIMNASGPVHIIAHPMSGHVIRSAYTKGRGRKGFSGPTLPGQFRGDRRAVLNIPGIGYRRSARHPGTAGKDSWRHGQRKARPKVTTVTKSKTANIIKRGFS